jgi:hypothetical protein
MIKLTRTNLNKRYRVSVSTRIVNASLYALPFSLYTRIMQRLLLRPIHRIAEVISGQCKRGDLW